MPHNKRQYVDAHELRKLVELAPDAYFLSDFDGRIIDVNRRACDSLGYSREDLLNLSVFDVATDLDLEAVQRASDSTTPGDGITVSGMHRRKDGSLFPVEARLSACTVGEEKLYLSLVRDVTERKIADDALRVSADRYHTLFNSIDEGFCVVEIIFNEAGEPNDYLFVEVNPAFEKHVGLVGATGKTIRQMVPDIEDKWIETYAQVARTGRSARFRETSPSLQQRSFDVYAFRFGSEGSPLVAILFANISERIAAEEALKESERLALIGRMAGVISHEINNPLDAIQNLLYMAEFEDDPASAREYLRKAQKEVMSASRIVSHTLNFTRRTERARREKLSDIVDSALTLLEGKTKHAGISINRVYRPQAEVLCLSSELRQVFVNLLANAFDAVPDKGTITVRIRESSHWGTAQRGLRLTIGDNGSGMSAETKAHLFQAFYTTKGSKGTGLGLWVSQEILARHGVAVGLKSCQDPGRSGTVFMLWFPSDVEPKSVELLRAEEQSALLSGA